MSAGTNSNTDLERIEQEVLERLSPAEVSRLVRLLLDATCRSVAPVDAAHTFNQARLALQRSLEPEQTTLEDIDQVAEVLIRMFDGFRHIPNIAAAITSDRPERRDWWNRAKGDALQLRDDIGNAISPDHRWSGESNLVVRWPADQDRKERSDG
ncbi:hypothetical protein [Streptomyces xiamenensis]|uniref:hypothetical protein n=1 Tax=Streptomyces xiamenensis TaxID=408015 RepID=UPI0035D63DD7